MVEPELYRLRGAFLPDEAEACYTRALAIAREQSARSWELRAGLSLARLWHGCARTAEARDLLADIYSRFGEGFQTPDLREAAALLDDLTAQADTQG